MENIKLEAQKREKKESAKKIIDSGFVPAILYGAHIKESQNLKIKISTLEKVFEKAGESTLINLSFDGKDKKILIKDFQKHPTKNTLIHVDLYEVDMNKEIHTEIPLHFIGESKAIKEMDGVLIKSISEIEVRCLPGDLVSHIDVDISNLDTFNDVIKLSDIKLPERIELVHEADTVVANVAQPREEEEEEVTTGEEAPAEGEEAPAEGEEKKAAPAEGEAPKKEGGEAAEDAKEKGKKEKGKKENK